MTAAGIPALLEPIQNRLNAAVNDPENGRAQLTFAVRATKDQARLLAAVQAVVALAERYPHTILGRDVLAAVVAALGGEA